MRITRLIACITVFFVSPAAFGQGAATCMVTQLRINVSVSAPGLKGAGDVLAAQAHFTEGTASPKATLSQTSPWQPYISHQITILLNPPKPLSEIQKIDLIHQPSAPGGSLRIDQAVVQATGDSASEPIFSRAPLASGGPISFSGQNQVATFTPAVPSGCSANARVALGAQRTLLGSQTNPPGSSGTLLLNGGTTNGQPIQDGGALTLNGGTVNGSTSGNVATGGALTLKGGTSVGTAVTRSPVAIQENTNLLVAQNCAKDPAFRILGFKDISSGAMYWAQQNYLILQSSEAAAFSTPGRNFTLLGCGFGRAAGWVQGEGDRGSGDVVLFDFGRKGWTNNSIGIDVPGGWNANARGFVSVICVRRLDGQKACALL